MLPAPINEKQQGALNWLRATLSENADGSLHMTTDYRENSPSYDGFHLDAMLEQAAEDYADWDES